MYIFVYFGLYKLRTKCKNYLQESFNCLKKDLVVEVGARIIFNLVYKRWSVERAPIYRRSRQRKAHISYPHSGISSSNIMASYKVAKTIPDDSKHLGDIECVLCYGDKVYTGADDGVVKVWTQDLEPVTEIQAHQYMVYHLAVSNDGTVMYSCSNDGSIHSWKLPNLEEGPKLVAHNDAVRKMRVLPDGTLASGDEIGMVCLWPNGGGNPRRLDFMGEEIWDLQIDGDLIYTARDRDLVVSQAPEKLKSVLTKATIPGRAPICLVKNRVYFVSREGSNILVHADHTAEKKWEKLTEMKGHEMIINALRPSKTGAFLYSGGYDNSVRIWDLATHEAVIEVPLDSYVNCLCAGADDNTLYAGGANSLLVKIVKE
ncbi:hypothetical protein B566_EDAN004113 [Ephemera danica]|nr:hypothetical protein B566_EDAN004113 [Ephemera danica]